MLTSAVPWVSPTPDPPQPGKKRASEQEIEAAVARFAALTPTQRELRREDVAKGLGINLTALDRLVKAEQGKTAGGDAAANGQGRLVELAELVPWPNEVNGETLLDELAAALHKYVILSDAEADATVLWLVRTHAHDAFDFNPPLWVKSVEKRSGKTRLCEVAERVAAKALLVSSVSASALLRVVETDRPTFILDELDALLRKSPELAEAVRGLVNSSFNRNTARHLLSVPISGGGYEVREFSMWTPLLLSGIGELPDTVRDRAIGIELNRKRPDEKVARLRRRDGQDLRELARKAARWTGDHLEALGNARPEMPEWINDRASDAWEPLFAIAELAGEKWRKRAEAAARTLSGAEDDSIRVKLLADIPVAFGKRDRLSSDAIVTYLTGLEERPWAEWGKQRKPISKSQVARLLRPLHVTPTTVDFGTDAYGKKKIAKGYHRSAFSEAFSRYLPPPGIQTVSPLGIGDFRGLEPDSRPLGEARPNVPKNPGSSSVSDTPNGLTVQNPEDAPRERTQPHSDVPDAASRAVNEPSPDHSKHGRITL
jgi:hypothetical protein